MCFSGLQPAACSESPSQGYHATFFIVFFYSNGGDGVELHTLGPCVVLPSHHNPLSFCSREYGNFSWWPPSALYVKGLFVRWMIRQGRHIHNHDTLRAMGLILFIVLQFRSEPRPISFVIWEKRSKETYCEKSFDMVRDFSRDSYLSTSTVGVVGQMGMR